VKQVSLVRIGFNFVKRMRQEITVETPIRLNRFRARLLRRSETGWQIRSPRKAFACGWHASGDGNNMERVG
jgi:hypothetical protein